MMEELKEELKKAYTMLDDFCRDAEIKSGRQNLHQGYVRTDGGCARYSAYNWHY